MSAELTRLQDRERQLERELAVAKQTPAAPTLPLDEETLTSMLGEETARVIATAREAAMSIRTRAEEGATRLLREASEEAATTRSQAELEAAKRLQEAQLEAQAHLEAARAQGRDMANEAREYRERVLADVGRRRELARMQLQQVISGRERLMQAFERARLVAVDVLVEVDELGGEPEELVNLALTTGPVPVMVPRPSVPSSTLPRVKPTQVQAAVTHEKMTIAPDDSSATVASASPVEMYVANDEDDDLPEAADVTVALDPEPADAAPVEDAGNVVVGDRNDGEQTMAVAESAVDESAVHESAVHESAIDTDAGAEPLAALDEPVDEDHRALAPVVSLFAGELDSSSSADRTPPSSRVAVDELFAKLKVAKAEEIARDVGQATAATAASSATVEGPPAGGSSAKSKRQAAAAVRVEPSEMMSAFEHRDEMLGALTSSIARKLKRVLADEQNEVLDVLRRKEPVKDLDTLVPTEPEHARTYAQVIHDDLSAAATGGAKFTDPDGDPQRRIADAGIIDTLLAEVEEAVVQPLRERLSAAIGAEATNDKLGQTVRGIYREWKTSVLDTAAGDLAASAYARGASAVLVPGTSVSWMISPVNPACGECSANEAAGVVQFGDAFPTGDLSAPAHLGCRCLVVAADGGERH